MRVQTTADMRQPRFKLRQLMLMAVVATVLVAMGLDTKVVRLDSEQQAQGFSPASYGAKEFPRIQADVESRAVDAVTLAKAIMQDKSAAGEQYGVSSGIGPVMPVKLTGTVGQGKAGIYTVKVDGMPEEITLRVQTGPAINGTDLRDATGDISFGQFTNQIEYQNAAAAINDTMKAQVLAAVDTGDLEGRTVAVTGVFKLINPKNWLITPVKLEVQ